MIARRWLLYRLAFPIIIWCASASKMLNIQHAGWGPASALGLRKLYFTRDSSHPSHGLFSLLSHGMRYQSTKSRSKRLLNSFYPQAIRLLNS